ncbi:MAG TPA: PAS domain-containing protein, partial [Gammaproteobacteria bacterium]
MFKPTEESLDWNDMGAYPGELHFRRLLDTLPAAAYTCDAEGRITYFNRRAEEVWGRAPRLNDSNERFCGSYRLYSVDGTPLTHD